MLQVEDLHVWCGQNHALRGVSAVLPEHEITACIGPSGCGKTTFLRTLNRMNDRIPGIHVTGRAVYRGRNIYDPGVDSTWLRKQVGVVFQKPNPFPMSIYDAVAPGPTASGGGRGWTKWRRRRCGRRPSGTR